MNKIIEINKLTFRYKDVFIFDKFSLDVYASSFTTIAGANGSGKSTLIKILTGIIKTDSDIKICDMELNNLNLYNIRKNIGVVFSDIDSSFLCETVYDDIAFTLQNLGYSRKKINDRINELSKIFNAKRLLDKSPNNLSGGEKCIAAILCALSHNPKILILDETLSMIDGNTRSHILDVLNELKNNGLTIINITHDLKDSYGSDRLVIINKGEVLLDGTPLKVMEYDKILNKAGIEIPFEIELSIKLKLYGLIDELIPNLNEMVDKLWQ